MNPSAFLRDPGNRIRVWSGAVLVALFTVALVVSALFGTIPEGAPDDDAVGYESFWSMVDPATLTKEVLVNGVRFGMTMDEVKARQGTPQTEVTQDELYFSDTLFGEQATVYYYFIEGRLNFCGVFFEEGDQTYAAHKRRFDALVADLKAQHGMEAEMSFYHYGEEHADEHEAEASIPPDAEMESAIVADEGYLSATFEFEGYNVTVHLGFNYELERPETTVGYELML